MSVCVEITYIFSAKISELLNNKHLLIFFYGNICIQIITGMHVCLCTYIFYTKKLYWITYVLPAVIGLSFKNGLFPCSARKSKTKE